MPNILLCYLLVITITLLSIDFTDGSPQATNKNSYSIKLPGRPYETGWDEVDEAVDMDEDRAMVSKRSWMGTGREFELFRSRGVKSPAAGVSGGAQEDISLGQPNSNPLEDPPKRSPNVSNRSADSDYRRPSFSYASSRYYRSAGAPQRAASRNWRSKPVVFQTVQDWWTSSISPNIKNWPKIQCRIEPTTTLKLRKTFRPLKTIIRIGADFNAQVGVWQFKTSWSDAIIGGKLTLAGRELQLTKSWQLSVGAVEDLVTRLRFRAAIDLQTWKAYARVGLRTERLSPINVMDGFTLQKRIPLDGTSGNVKLEVKANFAFPEPEIEYSTETQRSLVGMGDVEVSIDELNLLLDY